MSSLPLLSIAIWTPILFGAVILAMGSDRNAGIVRGVALAGALISFLVTLPLYAGFDASSAALQFTEKAVWVERFNIHYALGV
ncbi:MAG TPA: NADH-quinone oxidoreductase subunit M, partial [Burkholderiaceae bacterium]|nr:NADH-quinone oxidoreductase subunit M [Burkholderiaceae bacterium]